MRIAVGLVTAALFVGLMVFVTLEESSVECAVCVDFGGGSSCATVAAPDRQQAMMQAITTACTRLSAGVTQSMQCSRTQPTSVQCTN